MADLTIKVSEAKYKDTLDKLERQLARLKDLKAQLENKKGTLSEGLQHALGKQASEMIEANLQNVNSSIERTQAAVDQIRNYMEKMSTTEVELSSSVTQAADEAKKLFD